MLKLILTLRKTGKLKSFFSNKSDIANIYSAIWENNIYGHGISFKSKEIAIAKCLGETLERISSRYKFNKKILFSSYEQLKKDALNPYFFTDEKSIIKEKIGWIEGRRLSTKKKVLIPAQLIYSYYLKYNKELKFFPLTNIGSGVSAGKNFASTILNGIYEIIERDCFMTGYLNRIKPPLININKIKNNIIIESINKITNQGLKIYLLNINNDLKVSTCLSLILDNKRQIKDRDRHVPLFVMGLKSNINHVKAILGSIEEAYLEWFFTKESLDAFHNPNKKNVTKKSESFFSYKICQKMYFSNNKSVNIRDADYQNIKISPVNELKIISKKLSRLGFQIYYVDITPKIIKNSSYRVYRTIIPLLQPLCLYKNKTYINKKRLQSVFQFFFPSVLD